MHIFWNDKSQSSTNINVSVMIHHDSSKLNIFCCFIHLFVLFNFCAWVELNQKNMKLELSSCDDDHNNFKYVIKLNSYVIKFQKPNTHLAYCFKSSPHSQIQKKYQETENRPRDSESHWIWLPQTSIYPSTPLIFHKKTKRMLPLKPLTTQTPNRKANRKFPKPKN